MSIEDLIRVKTIVCLIKRKITKDWGFEGKKHISKKNVQIEHE